MTITNEQEGVDAAPLGSRALLIQARRSLHIEGTMTQKDMARLAGITLREIRRWETAEELPRDVEVFLRIADARNNASDDKHTKNSHQGVLCMLVI